MIEFSQNEKQRAARLIEEGKVHEFYRSYTWIKCREAVLERDHNECTMCKKKGMYTPANTVHHIVHALADPEMALEQENLMSLCRECHEEIHGRSPVEITPERW